MLVRNVKTSVVILVMINLFFTNKLFSQTSLDGKYLTQGIKLSIPLIQDFPKAIISVEFGLEYYTDTKNVAIGRGFGLILSGTYAKTDKGTVGTIGGGIYARSRIGYKISKSDENSVDSKYILSTPELSAIYLFGTKADYALIEFSTNLGFGYYLKEEDYLFSGELISVGVRPGTDDGLFFATFYPRLSVFTKDTKSN